MKNQIKFHIGLNVSNIQKAIKFYETLFESKPVKVKPDYAKFELDEPGLVISFIEVPSKTAPSFGHLGLRVNGSEELKERKSKIEGNLEIALEEENSDCCYALQDKFWVSDPDGYEWEVYYVKDDVDKNEKRVQLATCC
ncbi:MAG: catechol 2,3-dioxygenase-like lactoylglutathione lyase family enzyme [Marinoscillum sp.]|jgi:catechol 2,3-dioxygenase-like lactoylglutathione lyase family enzyme